MTAAPGWPGRGPGTRGGSPAASRHRAVSGRPSATATRDHQGSGSSSRGPLRPARAAVLYWAGGLLPGTAARPARRRSAGPGEVARYWRHAAVPGVNLLRARYVTHRYARHAHETYTLALIEAGVEEFRHDGSLLQAGPGAVALLNPEVVHTGHAAGPEGWSYRVLHPAVSVVRRSAPSSARAAARRGSARPWWPTRGAPGWSGRPTRPRSRAMRWPPPACCTPRWPGCSASTRAAARRRQARRPAARRCARRLACCRSGSPTARPGRAGRADRAGPLRAAPRVPRGDRPATARLPEPGPGPGGPPPAGPGRAAGLGGRRGRVRRPGAPDPAFQADHGRAARRLPAGPARPGRCAITFKAAAPARP